MKKNASCKTIRTNITNPSNIYKVQPKKISHLELLSCKQQHAPSIHKFIKKYSFPYQPSRSLSQP